MSPPRKAGKGRAIKVLFYIKETLPDGRFVISVRDADGNPECNGFGITIDDAAKDLFRHGYETVMRHESTSGIRTWFTRYMHGAKMNELGFAIKRLSYAIEVEADGSCIIMLSDDNGDPEQNVYGKTRDDAILDLYERDYEIVLKWELKDNYRIGVWHTSIAY